MYNNYNPYYRPMEQQYMGNGINVQPMPQTTFNVAKNMLQGKQVDSLEMAKVCEASLDGTTSYFPLTDNSAIVTKQLQMDGTSKIVVFKPIEEQKDEIHYLTNEDLEKALNSLNLDDLDEIRDEIKEIKKQLKKKGE